MNALDAVYIPLAALTAPWWARKKRGGWGERLGRVPALGERGPRPRIMLHAVSVGEVSALRTLVPLLTPEAEVIVSATTDTGLARARSLFGSTPGCTVVRYPLDFSWAVERFLDAVQPDAVGLVELEIWPNFVRACGRRGVPVCVINGRLSARSFKGYRRLLRWIGPVFGGLKFAAVQDHAYAERFEAMGVKPAHCLVTGSMKWDAAGLRERGSIPGAAALKLAAELGIDRDKPLIVAGSTAEDEEALIHAACPPGVQLVCAPRKPEHFDQAAAALPGCVRRSARTSVPGCERFVLDTIGELAHAYELADIVVMGRSFGSLYGSDPIEPAALGKPVVIGPAYGDFQTIVDAFAAEGGIQVATRWALPGVLRGLLEDSARREHLASAAQGCIRRHQGASHRHAELVLALAASAAGKRS